MPDLPQVSDQQGNLHQWQRDRIIKTLIKESKLAYEIQGLPVLTKDEATKIASKVETIIKRTELEIVSGPMIREITNTILLKSGYAPYHSFCTRVGLPIYDAYYIDTGTEGHGDNANLIPNAETSHKRKADWISKEEALLLIPPELSALHKNADLHIHDLEYFTTRPFCSDWDARYFFYYGLTADGSGANASVAGPAKHAEVAILQLVKVLGSAQTNCAGGQGYYNFLTFVAPYLEGLYEDEIKQIMQMFVYEMTQMMVARGGQVVFSSVQLSPGVPKIWRDKPVVYKGKIYNGIQAPLRTYGEFEREVRIAFDTLMDVMLEGDYWGKPFSFPKPEISIEPCFIYPDETTLTFDKKNKDLPTYKDLYLKAFALASKHGTPYFDNQLPEYRGAGKGISCYQCCAYSFSKTLDSDPEFEDKLHFRDGKHFSMGSIQVVTLNLPRLAYRSNGDYTTFITEAKALMDKCIDIFKTKRKYMAIIARTGRMPFLTQRPRDPNTQQPGSVASDQSAMVYTIGIIGINEVVSVLTGKQLDEGQEPNITAIQIMIELNEYAKHLTKTTGINIAFARTPAETTAQRFAVADLMNPQYSEQAKTLVKGDPESAINLLGTTTDLPVYYTNGTHVPPNSKISLPDRIRTESRFFPLVDGGNICHIWLGEHAPDPRGLMDMTLNICKNTDLGYFAFTRDITVPKNRYKDIS